MSYVTTNDVLKMIKDERDRQQTVERFSTEHDQSHTRGELARAAAVYAVPEEFRKHVPRSLFPWTTWWKPTPDDRIRELVKAGALICAEIERLSN